VFWVAGIHPFNSPLPTTQNGKTKSDLSFKEQFLSEIKGKHVHHITLRMRLRLAPYLRKPPPIFASGKHFVQLYHWQTSHTQKRYLKFFSGQEVAPNQDI